VTITLDHPHTQGIYGEFNQLTAVRVSHHGASISQYIRDYTGSPVKMLRYQIFLLKKNLLPINIDAKTVPYKTDPAYLMLESYAFPAMSLYGIYRGTAGGIFIGGFTRPPFVLCVAARDLMTGNIYKIMLPQKTLSVRNTSAVIVTNPAYDPRLRTWYKVAKVGTSGPAMTWPAVEVSPRLTATSQSAAPIHSQESRL
jgi:hypothetical protein